MTRMRLGLRAHQVWLTAATTLICACAKVSVTPVGSTRDGRHQYELTCNNVASRDGTCNARAVKVCDGDYETLDVGNTGPRVGSYNGQVFTAPGDRVLLIACNQ